VSFFYNPLLSTSSTYLFSKTRIELLYAVRLQSAGALWHLLLASLIIFFCISLHYSQHIIQKGIEKRSEIGFLTYEQFTDPKNFTVRRFRYIIIIIIFGLTFKG